MNELYGNAFEVWLLSTDMILVLLNVRWYGVRHDEFYTTILHQLALYSHRDEPPHFYLIHKLHNLIFLQRHV